MYLYCTSRVLQSYSILYCIICKAFIHVSSNVNEKRNVSSYVRLLYLSVSRCKQRHRASATRWCILLRMRMQPQKLPFYSSTPSAPLDSVPCITVPREFACRQRHPQSVACVIFHFISFQIHTIELLWFHSQAILIFTLLLVCRVISMPSRVESSRVRILRGRVLERFTTPNKNHTVCCTVQHWEGTVDCCSGACDSRPPRRGDSRVARLCAVRAAAQQSGPALGRRRRPQRCVRFFFFVVDVSVSLAVF